MLVAHGILWFRASFVVVFFVQRNRPYFKAPDDVGVFGVFAIRRKNLCFILTYFMFAGRGKITIHLGQQTFLRN
jgi:hypothetical protein